MSGDRFTVYSPIGGVVTHMAALEGDYVSTGTPIATVADLSRLWLLLEAYESQLPMLRWGQPVTFTVVAHPGETFAGVISFISPFVDDRTRTAAVRVTIDNGDGRLKPGMFATAVARMQLAADGRVVSNELAGKWVGPMHPEVVKDGPGACDVCGMDLVRAEDMGVAGDPTPYEEPLVVPKTAVLVTGTRAVVYVLVPGTDKPTYEGREIELGVRAGDLYIVRAGLSEGEEVVTNGVFKIDSAMQIAAKPSMMMPTTRSEAASVRDVVPQHFVDGLDPVYAAYLGAQSCSRRADPKLQPPFPRSTVWWSSEASSAVSGKSSCGRRLVIPRCTTCRLASISGSTRETGCWPVTASRRVRSTHMTFCASRGPAPSRSTSSTRCKRCTDSRG